jgi:surface polysaccharide O-acyltransferase-like enzyme
MIEMKNAGMPAASNSGRNYGIDLLRMVSMFMVVVLHVLGFNNVLASSVKLSVNYELAWLLETAAYCAVNVFALISGYVGYGKKPKLSRLIELTLQVYFYTMLAFAFFTTIGRDYFNLYSIERALFPFRSGYWYYIAYYCLFFFFPFINELLEKLSKENYRKLICALVFVFSVLPTILVKDIANTSNGYSMLWLAVMYIIGAYFKKYGTPSNREKGKYLLYYFIMVFVSWLAKLIAQLGAKGLMGRYITGNFLIAYTSPTILFAAVFLFVFFEKLDIAEAPAKLIRYFSPAAFGVYLLHLAPGISPYFIKSSFASYAKLAPPLMVLAVIGTAFGIWLIGSLVDRLRMRLFDIVGMRRFCSFIEKKLCAFCRFIYSKTFKEKV